MANHSHRHTKIVLPLKHLITRYKPYQLVLDNGNISLKDLFEYSFTAWVYVMDSLDGYADLPYTPEKAIVDIITTDFRNENRPHYPDAYHSTQVMITLCQEIYWELAPLLSRIGLSEQVVRQHYVDRWLGNDMVVEVVCE